MKPLLATLVVIFLLSVSANSSRADLCARCKDKMFTTDVGKCVECGADTASGAKKLCPKCSQKLGECEACRAKLAPASQPADKSGTVEIDQDSNGKTVEAAKGATIRISLKGNITTGYSWDVKKIDGDAVKQNGKVEYVSKPKNKNIVGAGGTFSVSFTAQTEGKAVITLAYSRPWEKDKPAAETFTVTIQVKQAAASQPAK